MSSIPHGFDDLTSKYQHCLQGRLGQLAPPTSDGWREILWQCWHCQMPWYQMNRHQTVPRLSQEQARQFGRRLGADGACPSSLPQALCPPCAITLYCGIPCIEEYPGHLGYRFGWERAHKAPARFLCCVYAAHTQPGADHVREALSCSTDLPVSLSVQGVLRWLATHPDPEQLTPLASKYCEVLARRTPAVEGLRWCGYSWSDDCPGMGPVVVVSAVTYSADALCSGPLVLRCWRHIASAIHEISDFP